VTDQAALRRFARVEDPAAPGAARAVPDPERRLPGRGAYVCSDACVARATQRRAWGRAFRAPVEPPGAG
jgi:predicted RNA-binding protein YlxR (DUF448 family)